MEAAGSPTRSAESPSMPNEMLSYLCKLLDDDELNRNLTDAVESTDDEDKDLMFITKSTESAATRGSVDSRSASSDSRKGGRSNSSSGDETVEACESPALAAVGASTGSALHGSGNCRPCAWFWKSQGCSNGQECGFCHDCPQDAIKSRKREKLAKIRQKEQEEMALQLLTKNSPGPEHAVPLEAIQHLGCAGRGIQSSLPLGMPAKQGITALPVMSLPPPPEQPPELLPSPRSPPPPPQISPAFVEQHPSPPVTCIHTPSTSKPSSLALSDFAGSQALEPFVRPEPPSTPPPPAPSTLSQPPSPRCSRSPAMSKGSALHCTRQCKPCGWFWKPQGCANGSECAHCHLCPEGEMRSRRRAKLAGMRAADDLARRRAAVQEQLSSNDPRIIAALSQSAAATASTSPGMMDSLSAVAGSSMVPAHSFLQVTPATAGTMPAQALFMLQAPAAATTTPIAAPAPPMPPFTPQVAGAGALVGAGGLPNLLGNLKNGVVGKAQSTSYKLQRERAVLKLSDCI